MKKVRLLVLCLLLVAGFASMAQAVTVSVDLDKTDPQTAATILKENQRIQEEAAKAAAAAENKVEQLAEKVGKLDPEQVDGWVNMSANAVNKFCSIINVQANELLGSTAGMIIALLIAVKVGAFDTVLSLLAVPTGLIMWVILMFGVFHYSKKAISGRVTIEEKDKEGTITAVRTIDPPFNENERAAILLVSLIAAVVATFLILVVVF